MTCFKLKIAFQEIQDGKSCYCSTVCVDSSGAEMQDRLANKIYEGCRAGRMKLPGFPDFQPLLAAMKEGTNASSTKSFRVSCQQHDRLVILESLARKWVDSEVTRDRAEKVISEHNTAFNPDGEYWASERRSFPQSSRLDRKEKMVVEM